MPVTGTTAGRPGRRQPTRPGGGVEPDPAAVLPANGFTAEDPVGPGLLPYVLLGATRA